MYEAENENRADVQNIQREQIPTGACTVGSKIIRAFQIISVKKLIPNAIL